MTSRRLRTSRWLRWLVMAMGVACVTIGAFHFSLGIHSVPGEGRAGATVDSRERFYGAIFLGYGAAWLWAARQSPIPVRLVQWLTAVFLLGGIGRVLSMVVQGRPQAFQVALTVVELVLPLAYLWMSAAVLRAGRDNAHVAAD